MKARPRRIENKVAELLSDYLVSIAPVSKVERIPVLGRTGPDIDILPIFRVAVDVKSRKANPKSYQARPGQIMRWRSDHHGYTHVGATLQDLDVLFDIENHPVIVEKMSKVVDDWLEHMDRWCDENKPVLPALVLHWPGRPVKDSVFVIYDGDRRILHDRRKCFDDL